MLEKKPSQVSIVTNTPCHFAVISKFEFDKVRKSFIKKQEYDYVEFLKGLHLCEGMCAHRILKIYENASRIHYQRGQILYREGHPDNKFYIIKSGSFSF